MDNKTFHITTETTALEWTMLIQSYCLNVIIIVGIACNVVSFVLFMHKPLRRKPFTVYHVTLAVWDTVLLSSAMVALIVDRIYDKELPMFITLVSYTVMNCSMTSCVLLTVAAMHERYIAITKPMKRWGRNGMIRALISVISISIIGCVYNIPKWFDLELVEVEDALNGTDEHIQPSWFRNIWWYLLFYRSLGGLLFGSLIPMTLVVFMGGKVIASTRASATFRRSNAYSNANSQTRTVRNTGVIMSMSEILGKRFATYQQPSNYEAEVLSTNRRFHNHSTGAKETMVPGGKQEKRVAKMIIIHGAKFTIAYVWPTVVDVIELYIMSIGSRIIPDWFQYMVFIANFVVVLNSASNILLYLCFCSAYRKTARIVWRRLTSCC